MSRLKEFYEAEVVPKMTEKFSYKNKMAVPKLEKIVINMGVGEAKENAKVLDGAVKDLATISGQKPQITKAKKSIANFKLREGVKIGCKGNSITVVKGHLTVRYLIIFRKRLIPFFCQF